LEKVKIGKAAPWIVQNAKDAGIDIDGYEHEISNYFIRHVINSQNKTAGQGCTGMRQDEPNSL
jgi:hypothetical protein